MPSQEVCKGIRKQKRLTEENSVTACVYSLIQNKPVSESIYA